MTPQPISNPVPESWTATPGLLKSKTILVTGAGDGIGATAAQKFAEHGATVILLGRTQEKLEKVYDQILVAGHPEPFIYPMDLMSSDFEDYQKLAGAIESDIGQLDGVLLNAAVLGQKTAIPSIKTQAWMDCMQINLHSNFLMTKAVMPLMEGSKAGRLLFTSSSVGRVGRAYWGAYAVSKFGVEGLMQVLADETENVSSIRINSINPGATRTNMRSTAYPGENPKTLKTPDDLMDLYLYLMSDESQGIHGQMIDY